MMSSFENEQADIALGVLETQDVGVLVVDERYRVQFWNQWMTRWAKIPESKMTGREFFSFFPKLVASDFSAAIDQVLKNGTRSAWSQTLDPERIDLLEISMNGGSSELPLHKVTFSPLKLDAEQRLCLVELSESPFEQTVINRRAEPLQDNDGQQFFVELAGSAAVLTLDDDQVISVANPLVEQLFGYPEDSLAGKPLRLLLPDFDGVTGFDGASRSVVEAITASGDTISLLVTVLSGKDGQSHALVLKQIDEGGGGQTFLSHHREVLSSVYQHTADGVLLLDREGYIEQINPVGRHLLGLSDIYEVSEHVDDLMVLVDVSGNAVASPPKEALLRGNTIEAIKDIYLSVPGQDIEAVSIVATPVRNQLNQIEGCVVVFRPVSEARRVSNRLSWQASHDVLTQLPNRRYLESELVKAIDEVHLEKSVKHTLLYIDLYNFSVINDTCGHSAGDELLRQFARLLEDHFDGQDIVSRIGNDEFAVLVREKSAEQAKEMAESLLETVKTFSFPWEERRLKVGLSIGAKVIDEDVTSEIDVLIAAGTSCAAAKESGRNRINFQYREQDVVERQSIAEWIPLISEALEENRFELFCQPIVPIGQRKDSLNHFEVLVRMRDVDGELVLPGKFIPAAEHYGLIEDIDKWVLDSVFDYQHQRMARGLPLSRYSINLSGKSIGDDNLHNHILESFKRTGLEPHLFQFEITETAAIQHFDRAMNLIHTLKAEGCLFSLDDFGSGLSSLGYLKEFPVDYLKIDGSFIRNMELHEIDYSMVSTINHLGHIMGIATVAECVENLSQLELLKDIGVDYAQGYYFAKPQPIANFETLPFPE